MWKYRRYLYLRDSELWSTKKNEHQKAYEKMGLKEILMEKEQATGAYFKLLLKISDYHHCCNYGTIPILSAFRPLHSTSMWNSVLVFTQTPHLGCLLTKHSCSYSFSTLVHCSKSNISRECHLVIKNSEMGHSNFGNILLQHSLRNYVSITGLHTNVTLTEVLNIIHATWSKKLYFLLFHQVFTLKTIPNKSCSS